MGQTIYCQSIWCTMDHLFMTMVTAACSVLREYLTSFVPYCRSARVSLIVVYWFDSKKKRISRKLSPCLLLGCMQEVSMSEPWACQQYQSMCKACKSKQKCVKICKDTPRPAQPLYHHHTSVNKHCISREASIMMRNVKIVWKETK